MSMASQNGRPRMISGALGGGDKGEKENDMSSCPGQVATGTAGSQNKSQEFWKGRRGVDREKGSGGREGEWRERVSGGGERIGGRRGVEGEKEEDRGQEWRAGLRGLRRDMQKRGMEVCARNVVHQCTELTVEGC